MRQWYAQRLNLLNLRQHTDAPLFHLRQIEADPELTSMERERRSRPLLEQIAKARDPLFASAESIKKAALKDFLANQPRNLRRKGLTNNPDRVTQVASAVRDLPAHEIVLWAEDLAEDGDDAALYGLELGLRKRDDVDNDTRGRIVRIIDKPYENFYNEAITNLVIARQEYARMRFEIEPATARTLEAAHEANTIPDRDGNGAITISEQVIDACYARAGLARSI